MDYRDDPDRRPRGVIIRRRSGVIFQRRLTEIDAVYGARPLRRQASEAVDRAAVQLCRGLMGGTSHRLVGGGTCKADCRFPGFTADGVHREARQWSWNACRLPPEQAFERRGVQRPARLAQQPAIDHLDRHRMLERVFQLGEDLPLADKAALLKA